MSATLALNLDQLKILVGQCDLEEKIELIRYLEQETFEIRFKRLLQRLKTNEITLEEISEEVEIVRQNRYDKSN